MEFKELQAKKVGELQKMLMEEKQHLYELRLKLSVNQLKQVRQFRDTRKNIARLLTKITELNKQIESK